MTVELLDNFETPELLAVKPTRTKAEYCWTCGPSIIWYFLKKYSLEDISYLDSDLYFVGNPKIAFDEIGQNSVAITEQGSSEKSERLYGKYCVQFLFFRNDNEGCRALAWWRDKCIEWCFQRFEDGRYADQKYLDSFPVLFKNVYVIKNYGVGIAPWNMHKYEYKDNFISYQGVDYPSVFIHMHGLRFKIYDKKLTIQSNDDIINENDKTFFYNPYAILLVNILNNNFSKSVESFEVNGISKKRAFYFKLRALLRDNKMVQFVYFKIFKRTYKGNGTIVQ